MEEEEEGTLLTDPWAPLKKLHILAPGKPLLRKPHAGVPRGDKIQVVAQVPPHQVPQNFQRMHTLSKHHQHKTKGNNTNQCNHVKTHQRKLAMERSQRQVKLESMRGAVMVAVARREEKGLCWREQRREQLLGREKESFLTSKCILPRIFLPSLPPPRPRRPPTKTECGDPHNVVWGPQ